MFRNVILATAVASTLSLAAPAAQADGTIAFTFTPRTAEEAQALRLGIALYALSRDIDGAEVRQRGQGNRAEVRQHGRGNLGIVHQDGSGHTSSLTQRGRNNAQVIVQAGRGTSAEVYQRGRGQAGLVFLFGW